jgi:S1/P1 Nuclease
MRGFLVLVLTSMLVCPAFGWWETGHQVVARIAAAHLTPAARTRISRILDVADSPEAIADALAVASTWADETKNQTHTGEWHFIDLALQDDKSDIARRCPENNCAPARVRIFASELRSHQLDQRWSELDQLRYLVHFVGDIHQPLHAVSDADQGGNCELLTAPVGEAKNLHALWDGGIISEMGLDQRALAANLQAQILTLSETERDKTIADGVNDWTWESHEVALRDIYQRLQIPLEPVIFPQSCVAAPAAITELRLEITHSYLAAMKPVVREQLIKGGLRLAKVLNESL